MIRRQILALILILIAGCSVTYTVDPANEIAEYRGEVCVVEKSNVRPEFLRAYKGLLETKGFVVRVLPDGAATDSCPITSTYIGKWSWDFVAYMAFAEILIFKDGMQVGTAVYEAPRGGWSMTTKIYETTETKIKGLVDKLFP